MDTAHLYQETRRTLRICTRKLDGHCHARRWGILCTGSTAHLRGVAPRFLPRGTALPLEICTRKLMDVANLYQKTTGVPRS